MKEQAKNQDKKVCPYLREEISPYLLCYNKFCYEDPRNLVRHIAISDTIQTVKNATEFELLTYHKILMEDEVERILGETECEVYFSGKGF